MSRENVELLRRATEAFNRGDYAGYLGDFAPDFEYVASGVVPGGGGVYRGREEYGRFVEGLFGEFDDVRAETDELFGAGDQVLVSQTIRARGKRSGAETTWSFCQVWTFRDGKITRGQGFPDRNEAFAAVGLQE